MRQQEMFFEESSGNKRIEVIKTYDNVLAREAFTEMNRAAHDHLWDWLKIDENFNTDEIPAHGSSDREEFVWDELLDAAREDGNQLSFFCCDGESRERIQDPVCLSRLAKRRGVR